MPKLFQQIVILASKDTLIGNMTKFQIATKPGHRASEHVFCIMSMMNLTESTGKAQLVTLFDVKKHFDKESAIDCQYKIYKRKIKGKLYRLIYILNENTRIRVRTPVGISDAANTGPTVGQGSISAAILSANSLDGGIEEYVHPKTEGHDEKGEDESKGIKVDEKI